MLNHVHVSLMQVEKEHSEKTVTASVICLLAARSTSLAFRKYRSNGGFL